MFLKNWCKLFTFLALFRFFFYFNLSVFLSVFFSFFQFFGLCVFLSLAPFSHLPFVFFLSWFMFFLSYFFSSPAQIRSNQVILWHVTSRHITPHHIKSTQVKSDQVNSFLFLPFYLSVFRSLHFFPYLRVPLLSSSLFPLPLFSFSSFWPISLFILCFSFCSPFYHFPFCLLPFFFISFRLFSVGLLFSVLSS